MTFYFINLNYYSAATLFSLPLAKEAKAHGARSSALAANSLVPRAEALGPYRLQGDDFTDSRVGRGALAPACAVKAIID